MVLNQPIAVMAVLVTASRGLPDLRRSYECGPRASPRSDAIHVFLHGKQVVDDRNKSGHDGALT